MKLKASNFINFLCFILVGNRNLKDEINLEEISQDEDNEDN